MSEQIHPVIAAYGQYAREEYRLKNMQHDNLPACEAITDFTSRLGLVRAEMSQWSPEIFADIGRVAAEACYAQEDIVEQIKRTNDKWHEAYELLSGLQGKSLRAVVLGKKPLIVAKRWHGDAYQTHGFLREAEGVLDFPALPETDIEIRLADASRGRFIKRQPVRYAVPLVAPITGNPLVNIKEL